MSKIQTLMAKLPIGFSKTADAAGVESPDEVQMEQDFGRLAYTFLKDRAAALIPYLLGFEVVDREEDGSRAIGIFGFKLNRDYYYVPVFFINNQIKGMDLLFNKRTNSFMPLRESWINYLVNKQTIELGGGRVDKNIRQDFEWPRFDFLAIPPSSPSGIPKTADVAEEKAEEKAQKDPDDEQGSSQVDEQALLDTLCANPGMKDTELHAWAEDNGYNIHKVEEKVYEIATRFAQFMNEGKAQETGTTPSNVPPQQMAEGQKVEAEHSSDPEIKKKITTDHLAEFKDYYTGLGKAEDEMKKSSAVIKDGFETWNTIQQALVDSFDKDAEFQEAWVGAISRLTKSELPFDKTAENSDLVRFLSEHGGVPAVNLLMKTITENPGFAKAAMTFYPGVESLFVTKFAQRLDPKTEPVKLTVTTQVSDYHNGEEKKKLVRDGFVIHDSRPADEMSETYDVSYDKRFANPTEAGLYNVLMKNGATTQAWVFPKVGFGRKDEVLVIETDKKRYITAEPGAVFVRDDMITKGPDAYEDAIKPGKMEVDKEYVMINAKQNHATRPFTVKAIVAENGKRVRMRVNWGYSCTVKRPTYGHDFEKLHDRSHSYPEAITEPNNDYVQLADYSGPKLGQSGDSVVVPSDWKALELNTKGPDVNGSYEARRVMEDGFSLGNLNDMTEALNKNAFHKVAVCSDDGMEYYIRFDDSFVDGKPMSYKDAAVRLVGAYGLAVNDAETMLKEAKDNYKCRRLVKLGQLAGVQMPYPPAQSTGVDPFTGAITVSPQADSVTGGVYGAPTPQNTMRPGFNLGGEAQMDLEAAGLAQQAASAGQKKVFDHAAIGGLSKVYDSSAVVDTYLPDLMKAMDRLGRIIFLFYWKNDEFVTRYGQQDVAEMEDTLRGVFKNFGDLILKLKQKTIDNDSMEGALNEAQQ